MYQHCALSSYALTCALLKDTLASQVSGRATAPPERARGGGRAAAPDDERVLASLGESYRVEGDRPRSDQEI